MAYHVNKTVFPFAISSRSPSVRLIELIDKAPRDVREEIHTRTEIVEQLPYARPDISATRDFYRWLRQHFQSKSP